MRRKSHVRCGAGEKVESRVSPLLRLYLSLFLLVKDDGAVNFNDLKSMVEDVNATQVAPEEKLTDSVYHYDSKEHIFELAEKFEARQ